jgi:hypothetical protein
MTKDTTKEAGAGECDWRIPGPVASTLVADVNAAGGERFLDHPQPQGKPEIERNRRSLWRESDGDNRVGQAHDS